MEEIIITDKEVNTGTAQVAPSVTSARVNLGVNFMSNVVYQGLATIITLWMTPFLIQHLGVAAYGMIPLVNTITAYLSIITTAINLAVSRFLAIDLGKNDNVAAERTFNTALFGLLGLTAIILLIAVIISAFFSTLFKVPSGWEIDSSWLFIIVVFSFFVSVIGGIFSLSPFIHSKFLIINFVNLMGLICRISFIYIAYSFFDAHLWYAGGAILLGTLVTGIGYAISWHKVTPQLHVRLSRFTRGLLRSLTGMGTWTLVNSVGAMMLNRVDLLVVNAFFGPAITGGYGVVAQISVFLELLVSTASAVLRPIILLKYSQGDLVGLQGVAFRSVKLLGLALSLPIGILCGMAKPVLYNWLGEDFIYLTPLLIIFICHMSLNLSVRPLLYVHNAYNRVRWPGIVTLICGVTSVAADLLIVRFGNWGYMGIAGSTAIIWTIKNAIYMPIYASHIMEKKWWTFLPSLIWSIIGTLFAGLISFELTNIYYPGNWMYLFLYAAVISLVYAGVVWFIAFDRSDKQLIIEILHIKTLQKVIPYRG